MSDNSEEAGILVRSRLVDGRESRVRVSNILPVSCVLRYACGHKETVAMQSVLAAGQNQTAAQTTLCPACASGESDE